MAQATPQVSDLSHAALMNLAGIPAYEQDAADKIMSHESGWCPTKWNGQRDCPATPTARPANSSGAYGLCQSLPAHKMADAGSDWKTNPVTQLRWCSGHAASYGGWQKAWDFWQCVGNCWSNAAGKVVYKKDTWW